MKRFTFILIAAAFAMTTACSEAEKVTPFQPQLEANFHGETETITRAPDMQPSLAPGKSDNCGCGKKEAASQGEVHFGELLPASFLDCGTFIRKNDGQLLEVRNIKSFGKFAEEGGQVRFGYIAEPDVESNCGIGTTADLTYISFASANETQHGPDDSTDSAKGSATE